MAIAIAAITIGGWFAYSALKGMSLAEVFKGGGGTTLDPGGSVQAPDTATSTSSAPTADSGTAILGTDPGNGLPGVQRGTTIIDGKPVVNWIASQVLAARRHGWSGQVTSGVRTYSEQVQACIHVCGNANGCPGTCAKPGTSNHEVRVAIFPYGAVDITNGAQFDTALKRAKGAGDAGPYPMIRNALPNDPVHRSLTGH